MALTLSQSDRGSQSKDGNCGKGVRAATAALAVGAAIGLGISLILLATGLVKRSYESDEAAEELNQSSSRPKQSPKNLPKAKVNHRLEVLREVIFLLPIIVCSIACHWIVNLSGSVGRWWMSFSQIPAIAGLLGSLWGYFIGCGVVWATRILGTLAFGKEAMGLGDVHLMGAAGAVIGPRFVVVAFFVAPFFGLAWAGFQMFFKKIRQIPYGPFLSLGILVVMILHDRIREYLNFMFWR